MSKLTKACGVCGRAYLPGITPACDHSPEEHARAAMKAIMIKHGPALRSALTNPNPSPASDGDQG